MGCFLWGGREFQVTRNSIITPVSLSDVLRHQPLCVALASIQLPLTFWGAHIHQRLLNVNMVGRTGVLWLVSTVAQHSSKNKGLKGQL